jgi:hypothetical protein
MIPLDHTWNAAIVVAMYSQPMPIASEVNTAAAEKMYSKKTYQNHKPNYLFLFVVIFRLCICVKYMSTYHKVFSTVLARQLVI